MTGVTNKWHCLQPLDRLTSEVWISDLEQVQVGEGLDRPHPGWNRRSTRVRVLDAPSSVVENDSVRYGHFWSRGRPGAGRGQLHGFPDNHRVV